MPMLVALGPQDLDDPGVQGEVLGREDQGFQITAHGDTGRVGLGGQEGMDAVIHGEGLLFPPPVWPLGLRRGLLSVCRDIVDRAFLSRREFLPHSVYVLHGLCR